ncbi:MAG: metal-dependent phosphoesterase [Thermoplasmata archaeon]|nr:MAG: metal-dependent phosphoesterase [Thermoplasmata archaeon]
MGSEYLKLDLHIHSRYSEDAKGSPSDIVRIAKKRGLDGIAITDHNSIKGAKKALRFGSKDFVVIPGVEISTRDGHLIALGVEEEIPRDMDLEETVELIIDNGGTPIVPHLFRLMSGIKKRGLLRIRNRIRSIEVFNGCSMRRSNLKASKLARELGLGGTGGSDAHDPLFVGYGYTRVENRDLNPDSILQEIEGKRTWGEGMSLPLEVRKNRVILSVKQFFGRGLKRI